MYMKILYYITRHTVSRVPFKSIFIIALLQEIKSHSLQEYKERSIHLIVILLVRMHWHLCRCCANMEFVAQSRLETFSAYLTAFHFSIILLWRLGLVCNENCRKDYGVLAHVDKHVFCLHMLPMTVSKVRQSSNTMPLGTVIIQKCHMKFSEEEKE